MKAHILINHMLNKHSDLYLGSLSETAFAESRERGIMKNFIAKLVQIPFDVLIGVAVYYCTSLVGTTNTVSILLSILLTALFAELIEVKFKQ